MDLRPEFSVYPRNSDGRAPQCPDVVRIDKLVYFYLRRRLDKSVWSSDCGSDVSSGAEKDDLWNWNHRARHRLNIAVQADSKHLV